MLLKVVQKVVRNRGQKNVQTETPSMIEPGSDYEARQSESTTELVLTVKSILWHISSAYA
jgi:hypothetical protein